jgi:hypothetical protein
VSENPVTSRLRRALELLRAGDRGPELEGLVEQGVIAALNSRLGARNLELVGRLNGPDGAPQVICHGDEIEPARFVIELAADGESADVRLELGGGKVPEVLAHVPLAIRYSADALPTDHRWWSDAGGLLMVGELVHQDA